MQEGDDEDDENQCKRNAIDDDDDNDEDDENADATISARERPGSSSVSNCIQSRSLVTATLPTLKHTLFCIVNLLSIVHLRS